MQGHLRAARSLAKTITIFCTAIMAIGIPGKSARAQGGTAEYIYPDYPWFSKHVPAIWIKKTTSNGCIWYEQGYAQTTAEATAFDRKSRFSSTWSAPCLSGQPISGKGILETLYYLENGEPVKARYEGEMQKGYRQGDFMVTFSLGLIGDNMPKAHLQKYRGGCLLPEDKYDSAEVKSRQRGTWPPGSKTCKPMAPALIAPAVAALAGTAPAAPADATRVAFENKAAAATSAGVLFAMADEMLEQGNQPLARIALRLLMTRFPDHALAAKAADRLASMPAGAVAPTPTPATLPPVQMAAAPVVVSGPQPCYYWAADQHDFVSRCGENKEIRVQYCTLTPDYQSCEDGSVGWGSMPEGEWLGGVTEVVWYECYGDDDFNLGVAGSPSTQPSYSPATGWKNAFCINSRTRQRSPNPPVFGTYKHDGSGKVQEASG